MAAFFLTYSHFFYLSLQDLSEKKSAREETNIILLIINIRFNL